MEAIMTILIIDPFLLSDASAMQSRRTLLAGAPRLAFEPASRLAFDFIMNQVPALKSVFAERGTGLLARSKSGAEDVVAQVSAYNPRLHK